MSLKFNIAFRAFQSFSVTFTGVRSVYVVTRIASYDSVLNASLLSLKERVRGGYDSFYEHVIGSN